MEVACGCGVAFELPVFDRAIAEDVHEFLGGLEAGIRLGRNDDCDGLAMPRDGLCALLEHGVEQFAEFVFCVLKWPDCVHISEATAKL
jgi:hypothetical protein